MLWSFTLPLIFFILQSFFNNTVFHNFHGDLSDFNMQVYYPFLGAHLIKRSPYKSLLAGATLEFNAKNICLW